MKKLALAIVNRAVEGLAVSMLCFATMFSIIGLLDSVTGAFGLLNAWGSWGALSAVVTVGMLGFALLVTAD